MEGKAIPADKASAFEGSAIKVEVNPPATSEADDCRKLRRVVGGSLERESDEASSDGW
jgi:hypothetical protein